MKNFIEVTEGLLAELKRQTEIAELYREKCAYMEKTVAALEKNIAALKAIKKELENGAAAVTAVATVKNETAEGKIFTATFDGLELRIFAKNGVSWWVGKDVANILGYKNGSRDIDRHVDGEDKIVINAKNLKEMAAESKSTETVLSKLISDSPRGLIFINESGLYSLILSSKMPAAKKFKRWVTSEVLPSIRKTGGYGISAEKMRLTEEQSAILSDYSRMSKEGRDLFLNFAMALKMVFPKKEVR